MHAGHTLTPREYARASSRHMVGWLPFVGMLLAATVGSLAALGAVLR